MKTYTYLSEIECMKTYTYLSAFECMKTYTYSSVVVCLKTYTYLSGVELGRGDVDITKTGSDDKLPGHREYDHR